MKKILTVIMALAVLLSMQTLANADGWEYEPKGMLTELSLNAVSVIDEDAVFVVGQYGVAFYYDGTDWSSLPYSTDYIYYGIWGRNSSDVTAVGVNGIIHHWNGNSWENQTNSTLNSQMLLGAWGTADTMFAVGNGGTILRQRDGVWEKMTSGTTKALYAVWGVTEDNVYAVGDGATILNYNGTDWKDVSNPATTATHFRGVWCDSENVYAAGASSSSTPVILHRNASEEWTAEDCTAGDSYLWSIWADASGEVYAAGNNKQLLKRNSNAIWSKIDINQELSMDFMSVQGSSPNDIYAVGGLGIVWHYNGTSWAAVTKTKVTTSALKDIGGESVDKLYAVENYDNMLKGNSTDWEPLELASGAYFQAIWEKHVVGYKSDGGFSGVAYHLDGATWTKSEDAAVSAVEKIHDVWGVTDEDVYAVGTDASVLHYNGSVWANVAHGVEITDTLQGLWCDESGFVIVVGENGVIMQKKDGTWSEVEHGLTTETLNAAWGSSPDNVYAVGQNVILHKTVNGWTKIDMKPEWYNRHLSFNSVWGSNANDVYFVGRLYEDGSFSDNGKMYHWDGTKLAEVSYSSGYGTDQVLWSVWGTSAENVYIVGDSGLIMNFNGVTLTQSATEQPYSVTVTIDGVVQNERSKEYLQANYNASTKFTPVSAVQEFQATTTGINGNAVFRFQVTNQDAKVADLYLLKLYPNGTNANFEPYVETEPVLASVQQGTWWIKKGMNVLSKTSYLSPDEIYDVYFVVQDNGDYDLKMDLNGIITDPYVLGTTPSSSDDDDDDDNNGCTTSTTQSPSIELAGLLLIACLLLVRSGVRRKTNR